MLPRTRLALAALLLPAFPVGAQHASDRFAGLDSAMVKELRGTNTPGGAVAVVLGDSIVYVKGFGRTSADGGTPVTGATVFRIASVTKIFTAATLVRLAEAGRLELGAPIDARLGDVPSALRGLTAHQLLSHTAGLSAAPIAGSAGNADSALADAVRRVPPQAIFAPPGEIFSYSNLGYQLAGRLIETTGGAPYGELVRQSLLEPLAMTATTFDSAVAARGSLAVGTVDPSAPGARVGDGPAASPFAGLYSNVTDLARFAIAFMNAGRIDGRQVLAPSTITRLATPAARFQSGEGDYGYALRLYHHRGVDVVEHGGFDPSGYRSMLYMVPAQRVAIIVLANRAGRRPYAVADAALDALLRDVIEPAAARPAVVPMDSTEMARYVGRYVNGAAMEVTVDDGVLTLHSGGAALPIRKFASGELVAGGAEGGQWIAFVPGSDGVVKYLHFNMRAFRRAPASSHPAL